MKKMKKKRRKNKKREGRKEEEKNESLLDSHPRSIIILIFTNITLDPSTMGLSTPSLTTRIIEEDVRCTFIQNRTLIHVPLYTGEGRL